MRLFWVRSGAVNSSNNRVQKITSRRRRELTLARVQKQHRTRPFFQSVLFFWLCRSICFSWCFLFLIKTLNVRSFLFGLSEISYSLKRKHVSVVYPKLPFSSPFWFSVDIFSGKANKFSFPLSKPVLDRFAFWGGFISLCLIYFFLINSTAIP